MSEMPELLPCPFCGGSAEIWRAPTGMSTRPAWVACMGRCSVLVSKEYQTDTEAIAAWNTRADLHEALRRERDEARAEAERLREALLDVRSHFNGDLPPKGWVETERLARAVLRQDEGKG